MNSCLTLCTLESTLSSNKPSICLLVKHREKKFYYISLLWVTGVHLLMHPVTHFQQWAAVRYLLTWQRWPGWGRILSRSAASWENGWELKPSTPAPSSLTPGRAEWCTLKGAYSHGKFYMAINSLAPQAMLMAQLTQEEMAGEAILIYMGRCSMKKHTHTHTPPLWMQKTINRYCPLLLSFFYFLTFLSHLYTALCAAYRWVELSTV